jgi:hypothetical protein
MDVFGVGGGNFTEGQNASFNLSTGAVITTDGAVASIEARANAYYRIRMTFTASAAPSASALFIRFLDNSNNFSYAGDGTSGIYLWGAQLEAGSFPTSYIPTTSATVTRSADVASITGANFSSWYRQDEGTVFAETQFPAGTAVNTSSRTVLDITDGTTNNRLNIRAIGVATTTDQLTVRSGAATSAQFGSNGSAVSTAFRKLACAVKVDDFASWATGATTAATDTSGAMPVAVSQASLGSSFAGTEVMAGTIRRLTYWPSRLPNSTLQEITR